MLWLHTGMLDERLCKIVKSIKNPEDPEDVKKALWDQVFKSIPPPHFHNDRVELFNGTIKLILKKCRSEPPS
jgi:hypothetical protein